MKHLFLAAACLAPLPALGQAVTASQPATVSAALQAMGLEAQMGATSSGTPAIVSQLNGARFSVLFYGCEDPLGCQDLQLRAVFATGAEVELGVLNDWNQSTFMGKAFRADQNIVLEHPIAGANGLSRYSFTRTMARWQLSLNEFRQRLAAPE